MNNDYMRKYISILTLLVLMLANLAQGYTRPWAYQLTGVSGYSYSVALAISPDATRAVGVSSNNALTIDANMQITVPANTVLVPTYWDLTDIPGPEPYAVAGQDVSGFTNVNAAIYGLSKLSNGTWKYSGTKFNSDGSTTGFVVSSGTVSDFSSSGTNSYGYGMIGTNGLGATGWVQSGTINRPVIYISSAPNGTTAGIKYLSGTNVAGTGYRASARTSEIGTFTVTVAGNADGYAKFWTVTYTGKNNYTGPTITSYNIPTNSSTLGSAYGITYLYGQLSQSFITGVNTSPTPRMAFVYKGVPNSDQDVNTICQQVIPGVGYGICNTNQMYVGISTSDSAFISSEYATYGSAYAWLSGNNWGAYYTDSGEGPWYNAFNIGAWSSINALYDVTQKSSNSFYYAVGFGNGSCSNGVGTTGHAILVIYEPQ